MRCDMKEIGYQIVYSGRKTLSLQVKETGELLVRAPYFVSKREIEAFVLKHQDWILRQKERLQAKKELPEPKEADLLRLQADLQQILSRYAPKMGVTYSAFKLTSAKKRLGSCQPKSGRLCFSKDLWVYPIHLLEYVAVHELAHLKYPNHAPAFHAFVRSFLPDADDRRKQLRNFSFETAENPLERSKM